jgi:hypothetical protein
VVEKAAAKPGEPKKFQDFNELTKDAKKCDGFITLHEKEQHLYAEIKPNQLEQPILAPIVIARGSASAGSPLNFGDEWVLMFRRVDDKLQVLRKNIHIHRACGHAPGQGGQAELHGLGLAGVADPQYQPQRWRARG